MHCLLMGAFLNTCQTSLYKYIFVVFKMFKCCVPIKGKRISRNEVIEETESKRIISVYDTRRNLLGKFVSVKKKKTSS